MKFHLDRRGGSDVLRNMTRDAIRDHTEAIAADVAAATGADVTATHHVTDRAVGRVTIRDPRGLAIQAKTGALTRAAARRGLDLKARQR